MKRLLVIATLAALLGAPLAASPAAAQVPPVPGNPGVPPLPDVPDLPIPSLPSLPAPPAEAAPVLGLVAPATGPVCGTYGTALVLFFIVAPSFGIPAGELFPVMLVGLQACGALPPRATRSTCTVDDDVQRKVDEVAGTAGQTLPVRLPASAQGTVVDEGYALDALIGAAGGPATSFGPTLASELSCRTMRVA